VHQPLVRKSMKCRDLVDAAKKYHLRPDLRPLMQSDSTRVRTGKHSYTNTQQCYLLLAIIISVADNTHCTQQTTSYCWTKQQYFKEISLKIPIQTIRNDKCSLSSTCSHTHSKSLSPLFNCFVIYVLVQLVPLKPFLTNPAIFKEYLEVK